jgi:large subunit ribosomal protein L3
MGRKQGSRKGSMMYWPRITSSDFLPRVNWEPMQIRKQNEKSNIMGFIGYKVGMLSAFVKDNTPDSMTKGKRTIIPVTLIECPTMKILSVRFYKSGKVSGEVLNDNLDKELKRTFRMPKTPAKTKEAIDKLSSLPFDDIHVIVYSQPKKIFLKKTPDISEIALCGKNEDKLAFIKESLGKEISISDVFQKGIVDVRGLTTGKGFQGAVKRFGVHFRNHKAEKGQRKVGSVGPWHPVGIMFTVPRPGRMGMHTRIAYNKPIISIKKSSELKLPGPITGYGRVDGDCLIVGGSVQGTEKRQMLLTATLRPTKRQLKKNYELIELR